MAPLLDTVWERQYNGTDMAGARLPIVIPVGVSLTATSRVSVLGWVLHKNCAEGGEDNTSSSVHIRRATFWRSRLRRSQILGRGKIASAEEAVKRMLADAEKEAEARKRELLLEAKEEAHRVRRISTGKSGSAVRICSN